MLSRWGPSGTCLLRRRPFWLSGHARGRLAFRTCGLGGTSAGGIVGRGVRALLLKRVRHPAGAGRYEYDRAVAPLWRLGLRAQPAACLCERGGRFADLVVELLVLDGLGAGTPGRAAPGFAQADRGGAQLVLHLLVLRQAPQRKLGVLALSPFL